VWPALLVSAAEGGRALVLPGEEKVQAGKQPVNRHEITLARLYYVFYFDTPMSLVRDVA